jgi:predicted nucleotidyltransferase
MTSKKQTSYVQAREALLEHITTTLKQDRRFIAAWVAGSHARGEQQRFSDLDLHVVVAEEYSETLCAQPWSVGAKTTPERLALFTQFGKPVVIYEVHANNLVGGTFTYVLYKESAINVDWMLIPKSRAHVEHSSLLLFSHAELPEPLTEGPPSREECAERASLQVGFFWMIAATNAQNLLHGDLVQYHTLLRWLEDSIRETRAALRGEYASFTKASRIKLNCTQEDQVAALRSLCDEMESLIPQVIALGGYVSAAPLPVIEERLALLE